MKHLAKQRDIIITITDKDNAVLIMDTENYIKDANRQLSDNNSYKTLQTDPTLQHSEMVSDAFDRFKNKNLLFKKTAEGLKIINPKTPKLHPKCTNQLILLIHLNQLIFTTLQFHTLLTMTFNL